MRLIDADELLTHKCHYNFEEQGYFEFDAVDVDHIRNAPTIIMEPKWVKPTDRLPENQGNYMCVYRDHLGEVSYDAFMFFKDNTFLKDGFYLAGVIDDKKILYWLEMPELPKK